MYNRTLRCSPSLLCNTIQSMCKNPCVPYLKKDPLGQMAAYRITTFTKTQFYKEPPLVSYDEGEIFKRYTGQG